jgi:uncharacterized repeat protein (TIGR03803 family)
MGLVGKRTTIHFIAVVAALCFAAPARAVYQPLYNFSSGFGAPIRPSGSVIKSGSLLYGMTQWGGSSNRGIIFNFDTSNGTLTTLHNFGGSSGGFPHGSLTQSGSMLYGLTSTSTSSGTLFRFDTSTNTFNVLHSFTGGVSNGATPYGTRFCRATRFTG